LATKDQYEFFRGLYDEEERSSLQLEGRAKVYLGIITAFLVTILLKTEDVAKSAQQLKIPFALILIEALPLSASLVLVMLALRIRDYEAVNDGVAIVNAFEGNGPTDEEFYEDRIADYAWASSRNRGINNQTSSMLAWAGRLLIFAMLLIVFLAILATWLNR
jgi:hypothetical protein